ncbi:hypothetical protein D8674_010452 [Pyrus ussuriensis x Pyrus communis]|uniref:RNase H type-1 domain-containing protein n=1 Tax=Pyrus ussuriensis x Pyrus communis TaxID=2448454 RepID=A0A5N5FEA1_9ROSA|nr:hypothetical protein D8674_010452 [Pyrus ussuriensis x Pyrus communis]
MNAWRLCMDIIPSKVNLIKRRITSDSRCMFCCSTGEASIYIFWDCHFATCVWSFLILGRLPSGNLEYGVVIHDSTSNFLAGLSKSSPHVPFPLFAEALAVREGLALADSLQITQVLCTSSLDLSPIGLIVKDSREIAKGITRVSFTHIRCEANEVAHRFAHFSLASTSTCL